MNENPINDAGPMIRWTIQYPESDLEKLKDLQRQTRINSREWIRALLAALVVSRSNRVCNSSARRCEPRADAERAGLLPPPKKRARTNQK